jgi:hypothetical protein
MTKKKKSDDKKSDDKKSDDKKKKDKWTPFKGKVRTC